MASSATVLASFRSHSRLRQAEQDPWRISANPGLLIRFCRERRLHSPARFRIKAAVVVAGKEDVSPELDKFACPICYEPLIRKGPSGLNLSGFKCERCNKPFSSGNTYLDLTVTSGIREYNEYKPSGTEMFRPFVALALCHDFSRGCKGARHPSVKQDFTRLKERQKLFQVHDPKRPIHRFKMAQEYFNNVAGGLLLDIRSGSGLFSRKFAKCETFVQSHCTRLL